MPSIRNSRLEIIPVEGHPGRRIVQVTYDVAAGTPEDHPGAELLETVRVHGRRVHETSVGGHEDDPVVVFEAASTVPEQTASRTFEQGVHREALDVERDWWSTGLGGETRPIAEWVDHLVADIELRVDGALVAEATTPVVTGSWGALGDD